MCSIVLFHILKAIVFVENFKFFTRVALREDFPDHELRRRDVAMIVEYHVVTDEEDGYSLEVFNAVGKTITVLVVSESQIELLMNNEVLHTRVLHKAS